MNATPIAVLAALGLSLGTAALAQDADRVAAFYKGKTVSFYIGSDVGGGYNAYARTVGRHMAKYVPGNPTFIYLNMPGAGGRKATAYVASVAAKDGSALGAVQPGALVEAVLGDPKNARYDPLTFGYVGSAESSDSLCVARKGAPVQKFADAFQRELVLGSDSKGSTMSDQPNLMKNALGLKFRIVSGYKGSHAVIMAMERGEVDGICGYGWSPLMSQAAHLVRENKVNLLVQFALKGYPEPTEMGVPMIWQFVKTDEQRQMLELVAAPLVFGRPVIVPAGVPPERLNALRRAFDRTMTDAGYVADAKKQKLGITPATGEEVEAMVKRIFAVPREIAARTRAAMYNE